MQGDIRSHNLGPPYSEIPPKIVLFILGDEDGNILPEEDQSDVELSDAESEGSGSSKRNMSKMNARKNSDNARDDERERTTINEETDSEEMLLDI